MPYLKLGLALAHILPTTFLKRAEVYYPGTFAVNLLSNLLDFTSVETWAGQFALLATLHQGGQVLVPFSLSTATNKLLDILGLPTSYLNSLSNIFALSFLLSRYISFLSLFLAFSNCVSI
jgi:hypothetical protein